MKKLHNIEMKRKAKNLILSLIGFIISIIFFLIAFIPYRRVFSGSFSEESVEWANFGSYLSGTLGPLFSFLSIVVLIITVNSQIRHDRKENRELKKMEKHEDLYRLLLDLSQRYFHIYRLVVTEKKPHPDNSLSVFHYVEKGKALIDEIRVLSRLYCDSEVENEIRYFTSHTSDLLFSESVQEYGKGNIVNQYFDGKEMMIYFRKDKYYQWFDFVSQKVINQVNRNSTPPSFFSSKEYVDNKKRAVYLHMDLGELPEDLSITKHSIQFKTPNFKK